MSSDPIEIVDGDLLGRVKALIPSLSKSDAKIARLLLAAPDEFIRASVRSIASDIGVSEPTVVRFCRNVGCEGFKDLKFRITQELAFQQAQRDAGTPSVRRPSRPPASFNDATGIDRIHTKAVEVLDGVRENLDPTALAKASEIIVSAKKVVIYGIGGSSAVLAGEVHNRLFRLGLATSVFTDSYAQRMAAATSTRDDVTIFVSSTGRPRVLLDSLELAKYYGARSIAITDPDSLLGREADVCLSVALSQSGVHEFQPNPMRFGQMLMIDFLAYSVAERLGDTARTILRQTRASVASLHGIAPQQPIGD
ncbi:MAG: MurR/RpiR family transcriptional regulator [Asticcacaulis sp.]